MDLRMWLDGASKEQQVARTQDIRDLGETGRNSEITLTLAKVVDPLPIPEELKGPLKQLATSLQEQVFQIIGSNPYSKGDCEGRGHYLKHSCLDQELITYTKGTGYKRALEHNKRELFGMFGPIHGQWEYDPLLVAKNRPPRIYGALYVQEEAIPEFAACLYTFVNLVHDLEVNNFKSLIDANISVPIAVATFHGLTDYLHKRVEFRKTPVCTDWKVGSVLEVVPSSQRGINDLSARQVAQGIVNLYKACGAIISPCSAHNQNFYSARVEGTSIFGVTYNRSVRYSQCPQADFDDLVIMPRNWLPADRAAVVETSLRTLLERTKSDANILANTLAGVLDVTPDPRAMAEKMVAEQREPHVTYDQILGLLGFPSIALGSTELDYILELSKQLAVRCESWPVFTSGGL